MNAIKRLIDRVENQNPQRINGALIYAANAELAARNAVIEAALPLRYQLCFVLPSDADDRPLKLTLTAKQCRTLTAALAALDKVTK